MSPKKPQTVAERFPDAAARTFADQAIDRLPETEPMSTFIDTWIATYRRVGGRERR